MGDFDGFDLLASLLGVHRLWLMLGMLALGLAMWLGAIYWPRRRAVRHVATIEQGSVRQSRRAA